MWASFMHVVRDGCCLQRLIIECRALAGCSCAMKKLAYVLAFMLAIILQCEGVPGSVPAILDKALIA